MSNKKFTDDAVKAHNDYRKRHQVSSLKHSKELSAFAQKWADHLASSGTFQHNPNRDFKGDRLGENIAMKWSSGGEDYNGFQAVEQWYSEVSKYSFSAGSGSGTGHFTQVVWKDSREVGIGRAQARDGKWIVVGNYLPAGNFVGRYKENVFPSKDGKTSPIGVAAEGGAADSDKEITEPRPNGSLFSRFKSGGGSRSPAEQRVTHQPEPVRTYGGNSKWDSETTSRNVTRQVREESRDGPGGYKKTVVTETTIGPDGQRRTVTRETVTNDDKNGVNDDFDSRFKSMGFGDDKWDSNSTPKTSSWNSGGATSKPKEEKKEKEKKPQKLKDFVDDVVKVHNKYRKQHGKVGDLKHNKDLSVLAQRWADHLAATSVLKHSNDTYRGEDLGENVATKWSSAGADYTAQEVVDQWYSEISKYQFGRDHQQGTGHFTQIVWKGSKEIGVGKSLKDGRVFVVCNYNPAGNVISTFRDNVFPA